MKRRESIVPERLRVRSRRNDISDCHGALLNIGFEKKAGIGSVPAMGLRNRSSHRGKIDPRLVSG
jgi:hypothetical protein